MYSHPSSPGLFLGFYSHYYTFSINTIDDSNLVNNGPFYYYKDRDDLGEVDFSNAGQIILLGVNHSIIENLVFSNITHGLSIYYSNNNSIKGNDLTLNRYDGINLQTSGFNNITNNTISNNLGNGISVSSNSNNNSIYNNTLPIILLVNVFSYISLPFEFPIFKPTAFSSILFSTIWF